MMTTRSVQAADLRLGDLVMSASGGASRVTLHRLQGAPPMVVLSYADRAGQDAVPAGQQMTVLVGGDDATEAAADPRS